MTGVPVHAQSLVKDGDFEQADPSAAPGAEDAFNSLNPFDLSWTITQGTAGVDTQNLYVFDGKKSLYLNEDPSGVTTTITQNLATTVGQNYTVSFYADQSAGSTGSLTVMFGGATFSTVVPAKGYSGPPPGNNGSFTWESRSTSRSILRSAFPLLLHLDQPPPNLPVGRRHHRVNRPGRRPSCGFQ